VKKPRGAWEKKGSLLIGRKGQKFEQSGGVKKGRQRRGKKKTENGSVRAKRGGNGWGIRGGKDQEVLKTRTTGRSIPSGYWEHTRD